MSRRAARPGLGAGPATDMPFVHGRPAAFLDRDGTLIDDVGFVSARKDVRVLPTVVQALRTFADAGYACVVISNQSGVARGYFDETVVHDINAEVTAQLQTGNVKIDAFYFCPHFGAGCDCRKPEPGMIRRAAREHDIDIARSAVIGDRGSDVALGQRLGIPGVLVPGPIPYDGPEPDFRAETLLEAAQWIVRRGA
jgi:D-glycero-D-manno-heptose 1,7-bisphosphate phosphatase